MNALYKLMLRGSAIGALSLVVAAVGCSSDDSDDNPGAAGEDSGGKSGGGTSNGGTKTDAGEPGIGGDKPNGGTAGGGTAGGGSSNLGGDNAGGDNNVGGDNVGGEPGGAGAPPIGPGAEGGSPAFGAGGETSTGTGPSVAKFCNTLSFGSADTTMILEVGSGADKVTFTASTGECAPPDGEECKEIPQGADVPIAMFDADNTDTPLDEKVADVGAGEDWVFWTDLDGPESDPFPIVTGTTINQKVARCQEIVYSDIP